MTPDKPEDPIGRKTGNGREHDRFSLVSHDLRAALSDILGGIRLIPSDRLDDDIRAHFERIAASGETLARLLDKTLTDEALANGSPVSQASNVTLSDFLADQRRRWGGRANAEGIAFVLDTPAALPAIVTLDRIALERVLSNLIGNAVKFTDNGTVTLSVYCDAERALCFQVSDTGPGLSRASLGQLFQYAGRPNDAGKPGSGLGLFIAKELSDLLGADLSVGNRENGGAEAVLKLPHDTWFNRSLRRDAPRDRSGEDGPVDLSGLRILLAEDNKTNQLVATQMLTAMGATYRVASDGLEALDLLEAETFDLALLDIEMPRMSGLELIKAVRKMAGPKRDMPLIALTAYVMREHRERILGAGADGIIAKPLTSIEELGRAVLAYHKGATMPEAVGDETTVLFDMPGETVDRRVFDTLIDTIGPESTTELLGKLLADTDSVAEGIGRGRRNLDLAEIRSQTHILISVAGAIGAQPLQHIAQRLNGAANRRDAETVDELCGECLAGLKALQGFILAEQGKAAA